MTPSERERRIEAAWHAYWEAGPSFTAAGDKHAMWAALDAADEAVPVVPATWDGLLEHLDAIYPAEVFTGASGDVGARLVVLARKLAEAQSENAALKRVWESDSEALQRAEAAARDMAQALDDIASFRPRSYPAFARNVLARHPSFSGAE